MTNPLGSLPPSESKQFRLNKTDALKILRFLLMQLAGAFLAYLPTLQGFTYRYKDIDFTPMVLIGLSAAAEALRRFLADRQSAAPIQNPPVP